MTYGERFKELRAQLWDGTLMELAKRGGAGYLATIYNIERMWRVPTLPTIAKHAAMLGCEPWELLKNVDTEYDLARNLNKVTRGGARHGWAELLERYQQSTQRSSSGNGTARRGVSDGDLSAQR